MKKKSTSQSAFFNLRVLIGLLMAMAGVSLALLATANPPRFDWRASSHPQTAQMQQRHHAGTSPFVLPPGFDCAKIHQMGIDTMENFRAHLIMVACGVEPKGKASPAQTFSKFVKSLLPKLPSPLAYGGTDVDLITSPPPENFPSVTQSETYTTA